MIRAAILLALLAAAPAFAQGQPDKLTLDRAASVGVHNPPVDDEIIAAQAWCKATFTPRDANGVYPPIVAPGVIILHMSAALGACDTVSKLHPSVNPATKALAPPAAKGEDFARAVADLSHFRTR